MNKQNDETVVLGREQENAEKEPLERDPLKLYLADLRYYREKNGENAAKKKPTSDSIPEESVPSTERTSVFAVADAEEIINGLYDRIAVLRAGPQHAKAVREIRRLTDALYAYFLPIVVSIAQSYRRESASGGSEDLSELIAAGNLLLEETINGYDPSSGKSFRTYVLNRIRSGIQADSRLLSLFRLVPVALPSDAARMFRNYQLKKRMEKLCVELKAADSGFDSFTPGFYEVLADYYRLRRWSDSLASAWNNEAAFWQAPSFALPEAEEEVLPLRLKKIVSLLQAPKGEKICLSKKAMPGVIRFLMRDNPELRRGIPSGGLLSDSFLTELTQRHDGVPLLLRDTFRLTRVESEETIAAAMCGEFVPLSLDAPVAAEDGGEEVTLAETVEDREVDPVWGLTENESAKERRERIRSLLAALPTDEQRIVLVRCGVIRHAKAWEALVENRGAEAARAYADRLVCGLSDPHRIARTERLLSRLEDLSSRQADYSLFAQMAADALLNGQSVEDCNESLRQKGLAALSPAVYEQAILLCCLRYQEAEREKPARKPPGKGAVALSYPPGQFLRLYHKALKGHAAKRLEQTHMTSLRELSFSELRGLLGTQVISPTLPPENVNASHGQYEKKIVETVASCDGFFSDNPQIRYYAALCVYAILFAQLNGLIGLLRLCASHTTAGILRAAGKRLKEPGAACLRWLPDVRFAEKLQNYGEKAGKEQILTAVSSASVLYGRLGGSLSANGYLSGLSERLIPSGGPSEKTFRSLDGRPITPDEFVRQQCFQPMVFSNLTVDTAGLAELIGGELFCFSRERTEAFGKKLACLLKGEGQVDGRENLCCGLNRYELLLLFAAAHVLTLSERPVIRNDVPFASNEPFADIMLARCGFATLSDDASEFGGLIREILRCRTDQDYFCIRYALSEWAEGKADRSILPVSDVLMKRSDRINLFIRTMEGKGTS